MFSFSILAAAIFDSKAVRHSNIRMAATAPAAVASARTKNIRNSVTFCVTLLIIFSCSEVLRLTMESMADIGSLSSLLAESRSASETRAEQFQQKPSSTVPTQVVNRRGTSGTEAVAEERKAESKNKNSIWDEEEVPTEDAVLVNNPNDKRPPPRYEYSYKQAVGTEDTFLGMGDKTPLTQDCTHLVVKIHFPGSTMKELDLDVKGNRIFAASKSLRLFTYLPVNVDDASGKAAFDSKKNVLTVTLPIIHEF